MENIDLEDVTLERNSNYEWKQVKGFEGIYDISNDGLIHKYQRKYVKEGYTFGNEDKEGYLIYTFSWNRNVISKRINRLVYETFVGEIPKGYDVHHKNNNRKDNRVENLELIDTKTHSELHSIEKSKKVKQYTISGEFITEYPSIMEAYRKTGISNNQISQCCLCKVASACGFIWCYEGEENIIKEKVKKCKSKTVIQYTLEGQFVAEYESSSEAERQTGINKTSITECCNGKRYKSAGGYIWKFKNISQL